MNTNRGSLRRGRPASVERLETRRLFSTVSWASGTDGTFDDPSKWSSGAVPGPDDDVVIAQAGHYTVSLSSDASVKSLTLGAGASPGQLEVYGHVLTASGRISVEPQWMLELRDGGGLTAGGGVAVAAR